MVSDNDNDYHNEDNDSASDGDYADVVHYWNHNQPRLHVPCWNVNANIEIPPYCT